MRSALLHHLNPHAAREGVPGAVVQSLLHHAIDAGLQLFRQIVGHALGVHCDGHAGAFGDLARLPLQGGHQAQIVQHGGTQQQRHVAHHVDAALGELADGLHVAAQFGVAGRDGSQIAQFHQQRAQRLADFVVQLAGDGAALLLLRLHQARG
jgi:tRNA A37 threonylcarbamoyltransferase TsaD